MSIANYSDLTSAIADWLARSGDTTISTIAPDLIRLAEDRFNYGFARPGNPLHTPALRTTDMETRSTSTPTSEFIAVPSDFLEAILLKWDTSPEKNLKYRTPSMFADAAASYTSGEPTFYTIIGSNFRLGPAPGSTNATTLDLYYYAKIPALTSTNTTNWLLTKSPNVYLYGALVHAGPYLGDDARVNTWMQMLLGALEALQLQDKRQKWGNDASGSSVANNWVY